MARHGKSERGHRRNDPSGRLSVTKRGYGFVSTIDEGDFYISSSDMNGAMNGDMVIVRPLPPRPGKGPAGQVARVISRAHETVVGRFEKSGSLGIVVPHDPRIAYDIFTSTRDCPSAGTGDIVVVRITEYPSRNHVAQGYIEEVVGRSDEQGMPIEIIIRTHGLETEFSAAALKDAAEAKLDIESALAEPDRRDIRDRFVFTIDPVDARDFDDALSIERVSGGLRLGVHIADVSSYVPWGSSIDLDARRRATSTYLVDRVIPMLPEQLSNDLCSLNPSVDRRAFTADLLLDNSGTVIDYELYPSVIQSNLRLNYDSLQHMLDGDDSFPAVDSAGFAGRDTEAALRELSRITRVFMHRRHSRGGIDFETVEAKVKLDSSGHPLEIVLRKKTEATSVVEEAMILANEVVAGHMARFAAPMVYRVHEKPSTDSLASLIPTLQEFDYPVENLIEGRQSVIQVILERASGRPEEQLVNSIVLRAMKRARYLDECEEHFGLASDAYTHFTSPIRRYPDLIVHRLLRAQLRGTLESDALVADMAKQLRWLCEHSSTMEREAEQASYESTNLKICEYMEERIGETYSGIISGVTSYGMFVRLDNTAEGLVRISSMGESFDHDPTRHLLIGTDSGRRFRMGQRIDVQVKDVSVRDMQIDFLLA